MKRNLSPLADSEFDVAVIGGGIFGACAARDAAARGLSVALIEREDFAAGVSANSYKMVHGGIRYLQHLDIVRLRESCRERSAFLRTAPHLVRPLPIVIPTFGIAMESRWLLRIGMTVYDALTLDRNRGIRDAQRQIHSCSSLTLDRVASLFPGLARDDMTGAAMFSDAQMFNPTRLVLAFVQSAQECGACVANYVEACGLLRDADRVTGVRARDVISGDEFDVRARVVINAAGPWAEGLLDSLGDQHGVERGVFSRDACFVVPRRFDHPFALAVPGATSDPDAVLSRSARHLFVVPWRDYSLIGVWHRVWEAGPDAVTVEDNELEAFIAEINGSFPALDITPDEVLLWNAGLVPFGANDEDSVNLSYGKRSRLIDHERVSGLRGVVSLIGIRYTMGRGDASRAVDLAVAKLGRSAGPCVTQHQPVYGGDIEDFEAECRHWVGSRPRGISAETVESLFSNYGTKITEVLQIARDDSGMAVSIGATPAIAAQVRHAIREEMALTLADIVFRRTDLATAGNPGISALRECAALAARELDWSQARIDAELRQVMDRFPLNKRDLAQGIGSSEKLSHG